MIKTLYMGIYKNLKNELVLTSAITFSENDHPIGFKVIDFRVEIPDNICD